MLVVDKIIMNWHSNIIRGTNTMMNDNRQQMSAISQRLKKCRIQLGKSTSEMATELGITDSEYKKIEKGEEKISLEIIILLDERFHINCRYLLTGKEIQYSAYLSEVLEMCSQEKIETVNNMLLHISNLLKNDCV